jgi:hypothetical protein
MRGSSAGLREDEDISNRRKKMNDYDVKMTSKIAVNIISEYADHLDENTYTECESLFRDEMRARYVAEEDGDFETYMADRFECFERKWFESEKVYFEGLRKEKAADAEDHRRPSTSIMRG